MLGAILDLEGPKPASWWRHAKTQNTEVHLLQGNQSTRCLRLEQPSTQLGPLFPPFVVERKASHCTSLFPESPWHRAGTGMGARGNKLPFLPFIHPSPILPRHLRTTYSTPEGPPAWPDPPSSPLYPKTAPMPSPQYRQLALDTLNYPSKHRFCWQPFLPSFQLFLRNRQAGPCCRELPADGWPASWSYLPQSHTLPNFSLWSLSSTKVNFTLRIIYGLPASDWPQLWWPRDNSSVHLPSVTVQAINVSNNKHLSKQLIQFVPSTSG